MKRYLIIAILLLAAACGSATEPVTPPKGGGCIQPNPVRPTIGCRKTVSR